MRKIKCILVKPLDGRRIGSFVELLPNEFEELEGKQAVVKAPRWADETTVKKAERPKPRRRKRKAD